jgi:hypothetical protein
MLIKRHIAIQTGSAGEPDEKDSTIKRSQIFDPLGLLGPALIKRKIFVQKLWAEELQWDQPLPPQHQSAWHDYYESLAGAYLIRSLRNVNPDNIGEEFDLFGFGDASQSAFGAYSNWQYKFSSSLCQVQGGTLENTLPS